MRQSLPAGPSLPPVIQTARWIARPTQFMETSRREAARAAASAPRSANSR